MPNKCLLLSRTESEGPHPSRFGAVSGLGMMGAQKSRRPQGGWRRSSIA
jgi:hypothetical protein